MLRVKYVSQRQNRTRLHEIYKNKILWATWIPFLQVASSDLHAS